ncbi:hypothetical protein TNCV_1974841 [Trichonephila clavipes]|nr:hypothetical protein TNCV_1974841 [Trichonephila clavipes]
MGHHWIQLQRHPHPELSAIILTDQVQQCIVPYHKPIFGTCMAQCMQNSDGYTSKERDSQERVIEGFVVLTVVFSIASYPRVIPEPEVTRRLAKHRYSRLRIAPNPRIIHPNVTRGTRPDCKNSPQSHIVRVYDAGHDKSGVFHSAEWHDGDWSNDGIRTTPLWVKGDIEDISSELDNGD